MERGKNLLRHIELLPFEESTENFESYIQRLENYLDLVGIEDETQKAKILLNLLPPKTFSLLKNLVLPEKPTDKPYKELIAALGEHLNPRPNELIEQQKFLNRFQTGDESTQEYAADLRGLTSKCNFVCPHCNKSTSDSQLKTQFIRGLRDGNLRANLIRKGEKLGFQDVVKVAMATENSYREIEGLQNKAEDIRKINLRKPDATNLQGFRDLRGKCYRCGDEKHRANSCRFAEAVCKACNLRGHLARVCLRSLKNNKTEKRTNQLENNEEAANSEELFALINSKRGLRDKIMLSLQINGKPIDIELDTGAAVSTMSLSDFRQISPQGKFNNTTLILKTYTGEVVKPLGCARVSVSYRGRHFYGNLYILNQPVEPIFGREWLRQVNLDLRDIKKLSTNDTNYVNKVFRNYSDVFCDSIGKIKDFVGKLSVVENCKPIFVPPRNVPYALIDKVERELDRLEAEGIISKITHSSWATPIVPVLKPNGNVRLCADYSVTLNKYLKDDKFPIPKIDDIFARMKGGQFFCTLDIQKAYLQLPVDEDSALLQTLSTSKGLYKVNRLMFGIRVAPAMWNRFMYLTLQGIEGVSFFFDDVLVQGKDYDETYNRLKTVLDRLREKGITLNKSKCKFFQDSICYLGYVIDRSGLHPSPTNIEAISECSRPKSVNELRTSLGLINYYHRFIPNMSTIINPLTRLLRKDVRWHWSIECQSSLDEVKKIITSNRVLMPYNPKLPLVLATDASPVGLGAVLSHKLPDGTERPIAYASRTLTRCETRYSQIDKEATAIYWGLKHFFQYCFGRKFTLLTDHKPLVTIFHPHKGLSAMAATRLFHYSQFISSFDYTIAHRDSKYNANADFLSRFPLKVNESTEDDDTTSAFCIRQLRELPINIKEIARETKLDRELNVILKALKGPGVQSCGLEPSEYSLQGDIIFRGSQVVIPKRLQGSVLEELHAAHIGMTRMKNLARAYCWWKGMNKDIEEMVRRCKACALTRTNPPKNVMHPWEPSTVPWQRVHVDFAGPFMGKYFLLVVDAYTKWLEVIVAESPSSHWTIRNLREMFSRFGMPAVLVSDNGPCFRSLEFARFLEMNGVKHRKIAPYHPSSNGQVERYVQTLKQGLQSMAGERGDLHLRLGQFLTQYRRTPHSETLLSPYELMFGRSMRTRLTLLSETEHHVPRNEFTTRGNQRKQLEVGDQVQIRFYNTNKGEKWKFGKIVRREGNVQYLIKVGNELHRRHIDQIWKTQYSEKKGIEADSDWDTQSTIDDILEASSSKKPSSLVDESEVDKATGEDEVEDMRPQCRRCQQDAADDKGECEVPPRRNSPELRRSQRNPRPPDRLSY